MCERVHCHGAKFRFCWPISPSAFENFIHKVSQDFFIKVLINCLSLNYKLLIHQAWWSKKVISMTLICNGGMPTFFSLDKSMVFLLMILLFCLRIISKNP